jgi:hypothetical protein
MGVIYFKNMLRAAAASGHVGAGFTLHFTRPIASLY